MLEARIEVEPSGGVWIVRSSDNLFSGVFIDRRSACRHALSEAEAHPGHVVVVRDGMAILSGGRFPGSACHMKLSPHQIFVTVVGALALGALGGCLVLAARLLSG